MQLFIRLFVGLADHRRVLHTPNHSVYVHRSSSSLGVVGTQDLWHVHQGPQPGLLLPPSTKSDKNQRAIATQPLPPAVGPLRCFPSRPPAPHAQRRDKKDGLHCMPSPPPTAVPACRASLGRLPACLPVRRGGGSFRVRVALLACCLRRAATASQRRRGARRHGTTRHEVTHRNHAGARSHGRALTTTVVEQAAAAAATHRAPRATTCHLRAAASGCWGPADPAWPAPGGSSSSGVARPCGGGAAAACGGM